MTRFKKINMNSIFKSSVYFIFYLCRKNPSKLNNQNQIYTVIGENYYFQSYILV